MKRIENILKVLFFLVFITGIISCNNKGNNTADSTNAIEKFGIKVEQGDPNATKPPVTYDNTTRQNNREKNLKRDRLPQDGDAQFLDSLFFVIYDANADKGPKKVALLLQLAIMRANTKDDVHWTLNNFAHKSNTPLLESAIAYVRYRHRANLPENRAFAPNEFGEADKNWEMFCNKMDKKLVAMKGSTLQDYHPNVYYWNWYFATHVLSRSKYWLQPERMPKEWIATTTQSSRKGMR